MKSVLRIRFWDATPFWKLSEMPRPSETITQADSGSTPESSCRSMPRKYKGLKLSII
jgi:hypothetical protein